MPYVKAKIARKEIGVTDDTLRKWSNEGRIRSIRGAGNQRLYDIESFIKGETVQVEKKKYIYCRVSSSKQKEDLERQVNYLQEKYPAHQVLKEIASGINFKRKVLNKIMDEAIKGDIQEIVVAHRDRLCRIAWDHFYWLFDRLGVNIIVDSGEEHSPQSELTDDLLSIIHVFSCRHYGQRRKYTKKGIQGNKAEVQTEDGEYEECKDEQEDE